MVKVKVRANIGPYPLYQKVLKAFAEEGGKPQVPKLILRLWNWDLWDGQMVLFLIRLQPLAKAAKAIV